MPRPIKIRDIAALRQTIPADLTPKYPPLPQQIAVSIIVPTFDRPETLRRCLIALTRQQSARARQLLVIDNHPQSELTPPIVAAFPGVELVCEPQAGSARARNTGIRACHHDIVVMVDDDVVVPETWLEQLLSPLSQPHVSAVTGQVMPLAVNTYAQQLFEVFGGLGRGWQRREVDRAWADTHRFTAVPSWEFGATVNAAFRREIFDNRAIGWFHEALGGGVPAKGGEDTYFLYKVLQGGGTIVYEPTAWLWHEHRAEFAAFARQVTGYRQGHIAHHLTALVEEGDWRTIPQLLLWLNLYDGWRIQARLRRQIDYPLGLILREIWGNFTGVWCWWKSRRIWHKRQQRAAAGL
ncbi:glycosyltransferase [filamentous cyanobacterium LEGE 11480]|uniref:Glycosyltransferase n=1 Tax=Romeriopsis navalis LEGE 11480 TaxID=2777977 RepID=A0A928VRD5_9CYAN|nr:glycosyltransferase [Romeriopsis navalis]MBE9030714.1 glycosyltransferase [Romeriopsis navalis LEGE 11480]